MNNNPFEPVTTDPAVDPPQTDNAADDFTADSGDNVDVNVTSGGEEATKAPLSIDGISPSYGDDVKVMKIDEDGNSTVESATASDDILTNDTDGDFLNTSLPDEPSTAPINDETPTLAAVPPTNAKPTKTVRISLLTIILFILAIAGIAGAVWFYLQNSKNADALADSQAKVQQLEDQLKTKSNSEDTTAGQYDGLNDKIGDLSSENSKNLKTIEEYKKKNDELTKQVADLTAKNTELNKQATNISSLITRIDKLLPLLEIAFGNQP